MEAAANYDDDIPNDLKNMIKQYPIKEFSERKRRRSFSLVSSGV